MDGYAALSKGQRNGGAFSVFHATVVPVRFNNGSKEDAPAEQSRTRYLSRVPAMLPGPKEMVRLLRPESFLKRDGLVRVHQYLILCVEVSEDYAMLGGWSDVALIKTVNAER